MFLLFSNRHREIKESEKSKDLKNIFYRNLHTVHVGFRNFPFQVKTDASELPEEYQASKEYQAIAYSSLSQSYIYIAWTENYKPMLVGEFLNIIVTPKSPYIDKITHYNYLVSTMMRDPHPIPNPEHCPLDGQVW